MINVVDTPNPDTKKFVFDQTIVKMGSKEFKKNDQSNIDLVNDLFLIKNLELVYLDKNFISIKKNKDSSWDDIVQDILETLNKRISENFNALSFEEESEFTDDISKRIEEPRNAVPPLWSKGGEISTKSAPIKFIPESFLMTSKAWKEFGPPTSGVPVPGAKAGSIKSISYER